MASQCRVTFNLRKHPVNPDNLAFIFLTVKHPDYPSDIASLAAVRIYRPGRRIPISHSLDPSVNALRLFSFELFTRHGNVQSVLVDEGHRSGTGCWGRELNDGTVLYLSDINVIEPMRGKGIASWTLRQLMASRYLSRTDFIICSPRTMNAKDTSGDLGSDARARRVAFFRKHNFRRIGMTGLFGYSPDPGHPSRSLPATSDADAASDAFVSVDNVSRQERFTRFPLHSKIRDIHDDSIVTIITDICARDPVLVHRPDENGFTPVFVAVVSENLFATYTLLELDVRADLFDHRNAEGVTPLEKLNDDMDLNREFVERFCRKWDGFTFESLRIEVAVRKAMGIGLYGTDEEHLLRRRWGCNCGLCFGGWMSRRMRSRLERAAETLKDNINLLASIKLSPFEQQGKPILALESTLLPGLDYLPLHLRVRLYKSFYEGYSAVFRAIHIVMAQPTCIPSLQIISAVVEKLDSRSYLDKGGRIEYALDAVTDIAKEESMLLSDGMFEGLLGDCGTGGENECIGLPHCDNDLDFDLVRRMLGLDPRELWGPYSIECADYYGIDEDDDEEGEEDKDEGELGESENEGDVKEDDDEDEDEDEDDEDEDEDEDGGGRN